MEKKYKRLLWAIFLDGVGLLSYWLPFLGEGFDAGWAPIAAWIFYKMFGGKVGIIGAAITFVEEILPFTDFVPSFTIAWLVQEFMLKKKELKE